MDDAKTGRAGQLFWMAASVLALLVWMASMSLDDDRVCTPVPVCFGMAVVVLLGVMGMVAGCRVARPTPVCLFGLAAGVYFLARCVMGDMLSEIALELPLFMVAFTFYGMGYLMARRWGGTALAVALTLGVLANVGCFYALHHGLLPMEATGRPEMGLAGKNVIRGALFGYRNFVAIFLLIAGAVLLSRVAWGGWKGWRSLLPVAVGAGGVACSFLIGSRMCFVLPPVLLPFAWLLWLIIRMYSGKSMGYGVVFFGLVLFVLVSVILGELFMGDSLLRQFLSVDTHMRTAIWSELVRLLPQAPWCGYGAGASQWMLVPVYEGWNTPNYAHNEYLQAWMDYGIMGVGLVVAVLISHLVAGFWKLASEDIDIRRRSFVASCMLILIGFALSALVDFVWHNMALVGLTAFACGGLAAPVPSRRESLFVHRNWAPGHRPSLRPVQHLGRSAMALCCMLGMALCCACTCFAWRLLPAWKAQWEYNALYHSGASDGERVEFLERVMLVYPDPDVVEHYIMLSPPAGRKDNAARKEAMLRMAYRTNPHQLYNVVRLVEVLGRSGKYAEAEELMRRHYVRGGQPENGLANWPAYYGMNLLKWGYQRMQQGDHASALSMMEYALNLWGYADGFHHKRILKRNRVIDAYVAARRVDVDMLRAIGGEKDDSWMRPMSPGGAPALYERWGHEAHSRKFTNPYSKRSPLKR